MEQYPALTKDIVLGCSRMLSKASYREADPARDIRKLQRVIKEEQGRIGCVLYLSSQA